MSLPTETRRLQIYSYLDEAGEASIDQLSAIFKVSGMTIRRDLTELDHQGKIQRVHGGAIVNRFSYDQISVPKNGNGSSQPDVLILNPMDQRAAGLIIQKYNQLSIPIIAESIPFPGTATLIAIDSYQAGCLLGEWVGKSILEQMAGKARILFVGLHSYSDTTDRERGFFDGLNRIIISPLETIRINGQGLRKESYHVSLAVLSMHTNIDVMIGVNDQTTLGIMDAAKVLKYPLGNVIVGTFGLEGLSGKEMLLEYPQSVGVAMFPEWIGRACVDAAVLAYNHIPLNDQIVMPVRVITADSLVDYYKRVENGWELNDEVSRRLQADEFNSIGLRPDGTSIPSRIDFVRYLKDDYYEQLIAGMLQHAKSLGIEVRITDASDDLVASVELARHDIARAAAELVMPGESVIVDSGTTNLYLASELMKRQDIPITVISHSLAVLDMLKSSAHINVIGVGGLLNRENLSFLGTQAESSFDNLHVDKAFIEVDGVSVTFGITNANYAESEMKRHIIKAAREVIVLADSYKIGEVALAHVAPTSSFHKLVCDDQITSQNRVAFNQAGVEIILANNRF